MIAISISRAPASILRRFKRFRMGFGRRDFIFFIRLKRERGEEEELNPLPYLKRYFFLSIFGVF